MSRLVRLPADYRIYENQAEPLDRDQFLSLHKLPALSRLDLERFRPISKDAFASRMPAELTRDFASLRASMFSSLKLAPELLNSLVSWAADRELINLPIHIRDTDEGFQIGGKVILEHLSGSNSTWFLKAYHQNLSELEGSQKVLEKRFESIKAEFVRGLRPLIHGGIIPISEEQVWKKLSDVDVLVQDFFRTPYHCICFAGQTRTILVQSIDLDANDHADFFHELFHAIAGTSIVAREEQDGLDICLQRGGFAFSDPYDIATESDPHFGWLNEAVTEYLTRLLVPVSIAQQIENPESGAYQTEIALLELLVNKWGISQQVIFEAYFQDHDPAKPLGSRFPAWRALIDEFNFAFEPRFLQALDRFIWCREEAAQQALEILEGEDFSVISCWKEY